MSQNPFTHGLTISARHMWARFGSAREATVPFWPRAGIIQRADHRLRAIVRLAVEHVPWYRDQLAQGALDPDAIRGIADLDRWPEVPGTALRDQPERLLSERVDRARCISLLSSGSTGARKTIFLDEESFVRNVAYESRNQWMVYRLTGKLFGLRRVSIIVRGGPLDELGRRYARIFRTSGTAVSPRHLDVFSTFDEKLAAINDVRPHIVGGVAGAVADFFLEAHDRGVPCHRPLLISGTAEAVGPAARLHLERDCGIPVRLRYTSVEAPRIAFECEAGDGYHIDEDVCVVRIVDDDGHDLPEGESGRVVLTNLANPATVLINYDQGDRGRISLAPCSCGRRFKRLWLEETRETPLLRTPTNRTVHYGEVLRPLVTRPGFEGLQVIAERADTWHVLLRTRKSALSDWKEKVTAVVKDITNNEVRVKVSVNTAMELSESGKQLPVIIRCADQPPYAKDHTL